MQFSDTMSWSLRQTLPALWRQHRSSHFRRHRQRTGYRDPRHFHVPDRTTTAPFGQLTLTDVQNYTQPINFGISSYELPQWLNTVSCRTTFTCAAISRLTSVCVMTAKLSPTPKHDFAPRIGFGWNPGAISRLSIRAATRCITRKSDRMLSPVIS